MTSLIFGSIYMGHKGFVKHRREKQRQKNYERWEGLRDEYDEQRKITRESRSLDIQRTGVDYDQDRPILTLRDQQEANDARTSWRPQESFDAPRRTSVDVTAGSGLRPVSTNKTGATWDEGLPQPLKVSRRNWDDYAPVSRSSSLRQSSTPDTPPQERSTANTPPINNKTSPHLDVPSPTSHPHASRSVSTPVEMFQHTAIEPIEYANPGGRMAELIEMDNPHRPSPYTHQSPQTYAGYSAQPYAPPVPAPQPNDGSMNEWWK